jgi:uncharacterized integral membrane protein (TIGR00698 family)
MPTTTLKLRARAWPERAQRLLPGAGICGVLALAATFVAEHQGGPQLLYALLFGMCFNYLLENPRLGPGIEFTAKTLLRVGVALLGVRISLTQIVALGWFPLLIVVVGVASTIGVGVLCARTWARADTHTGLLTGSAVAICGASAAMALSAVLPQDQETEQRTLLTVVGVTALSTLAMIFYPPLASLLGLDDHMAGVFLGGTIHDVAQVVGAGLIFSPQAAETATLVKLMRVALLVPVVFAASLYTRRLGQLGGAKSSGSAWSVLPLFLLGFIALVILNSATAIPESLTIGLTHISRWCLVISIAALGMRTSLGKLASLGWRPVALLVAETAWLALLVLLMLWLLPLGTHQGSP